MKYEIRAWKEHEWVLVRAFREGEPVGLLYGVSPSESHDFRVVRGADPVDALMDVAVAHLGDDETDSP